MGQSESVHQQFPYAIPIGQAQQGQSSIYRNKDFPNELMKSPSPEIQTMQDLIEHGYKKYKKYPLIGKQEGKLKKYKYRTYEEEYQDARKIGSYVCNQELFYFAQEYKNYAIKFVGIFMINCIEWNTIDMACSLYGLVMVPFYDNLEGDQITYILKQTNLITVFCTEKQAQALLKTSDLGNLKNIIMIGTLSTEDRQKVQSRGLKIIEYSEVLQEGQKNQKDLPKDIKPTDVFTFSYTSGSTGVPKGVMMTHISFLSPIAAVSHMKLKTTDRMLCYMPLAHGTSRFCNILSWYHGSKIGLSCGDMTKLTDDLQKLKPTIFITVPTLFNKMYEVINDQFSKLTGCKGSLIKHAVATKLASLKKKQLTHVIYDQLVFNKIKNIFGGCVRVCFSASAPISKEVLDFFKISLGINVQEAFGLTEAGGIQFLTSSKDFNASGMVGGPCCNVEIKLVDVPEFGFLSSDKSESGSPLPRGEIWTRGPGQCIGYYKDEEKTKEMFDQDGWLHSGDIGVIYPNGSLRVIGRISNLFKLKNGSIISPERIENTYVRVKGVSEVFITSNASEEYVVAVVVPQKDFVINLMKKFQGSKQIEIQNNTENKTQNSKTTLNTNTRIQEDQIALNFEESCKNSQVIEYFQNQFDEYAKLNEMHSKEYVKKIIIESQSFHQLKLYTQSLKLQRFFARKHFISQLEKI